MKNTIAIIIVLVVVAGIVLAVRSPKKDAMMKDDSMMQNDSMQKEGDTMMSDDTMMDNKDSMMQGEDMMKKEGAMMDSDQSMMVKGSYEAYAPEKIARAEKGNVVLFFRASWCPTCRSLDADIRSHLSAIPSDLTILDVNYDAEKALKAKYGVTYQHTFVQVDAQGNQLKKWSGSPTLTALAAEVI